MITIGSRGSALALAQTGWVCERIRECFPGEDIRIKIIKTSADKNPTASIRAASSIGVFVKELEQALLNKQIDLAVHSMKDLPTSISPGLRIAAVPEREDARDAFIARDVQEISALPAHATVGTGSVRRQAQLLLLRPDIRVVDMRGNVDTRLRKLQDGNCDAIILACAGLNRLGLQDRISSRLEFTRMLPAPGQGALAIETREDDPHSIELAASLDHPPTAAAVAAERLFLQRLGGGCNVPVAVFAHFGDGYIDIEGLVASPDGKKVVRESIRQTSDRSIVAAEALADRIIAGGARDILDSLNR